MHTAIKKRGNDWWKFEFKLNLSLSYWQYSQFHIQCPTNNVGHFILNAIPKNIYSQVLVSYNKRNLNKSKWSKLKYGFRFEKLDAKTNEYYQYDFDFIKNNIYYLYIEE